MVTYEGAQKLLALCPKATFHVDLDVSTNSCIGYHFLHPAMRLQLRSNWFHTEIYCSSCFASHCPH
jgi:hypothetical protein